MALIKDDVQTVFDLREIGRGDFIRARHAAWPAPQNGIVAQATADRLLALYVPDIGNVTNYFPILAGDVAAGLWEVTWSRDLTAGKEAGTNDAR